MQPTNTCNSVNLAINGITPLGEPKINEKKNQEDVNQTFKRNFYFQQQNIRNNIQIAIKNSDQTWTDQSVVHEDIIRTQLEGLKDSITNKTQLTVVIAGIKNEYVNAICDQLSGRHVIKSDIIEQASKASVDVILAPHTLYGEMQHIFNSSEALLKQNYPLQIEDHPLFKYFSVLKENGVFIATLTSGPDITSFTDLLLNKHELDTEKANRCESLNLKIFNNVETFLRCLDIFKTKFEEKTGNTIEVDLSYSMTHQPLDVFCVDYIRRYPEIAIMDALEREKYIRLLSVFNVDDSIVDLNVTLKMTVKEGKESVRSFMPINQKHEAVQTGSNDISLGQLDLKHQIQNLNGSDESMRYIKDADGRAQLRAFHSILGRKDIKIVDIGGGRGETNAVPNALKEAGSEIHLLNIEPDATFADPYIRAYSSLGIHDVHVKQLYAQKLSSTDVTDHFNGEKVDAVYASHCFYFILGDMFKASLDKTMSLENHPLCKYIDMMREDGVLVVTMQSGAGSRLFRNALLGNHGLNPSSAEVPDETVPLLSSFGNIATFLRHFEVFAKRFQMKTGKAIELKMHYAVANVPLAEFKVDQDKETGGYILHNPKGADTDPAWLSPTMLDFYGNWKEQQNLATLTLEKIKIMPSEELKRLKLENASQETIISKRDLARKTQETFLHILRACAPAEVNMQHPNITLEIRIK
jgi:hypothetical protein